MQFHAFSQIRQSDIESLPTMHYYASNPSFSLENSLLVCQFLSSELCCEHLVNVGGGGGGSSPPQWCCRSSKSLQLCEDRPGTEMIQNDKEREAGCPLPKAEDSGTWYIFPGVTFLFVKLLR